MGVRLEDLPLRAQQQAVHKLAEQERRKIVEQERQKFEKRTSKYNNQKDQRTTEAGTVLRFDSRKEARRYDQLMALGEAGKIRGLKLQPQFTLQEAYTTTEGVRVRAIRYQADFSYEREASPDKYTGDQHWVFVVEDVKSRATMTRVYAMKKKLMRERFGIEIQEV